MVTSSRRWLAAAAGLAALSAPAFAGEFSSVYTRHDYQACTAQPSPHPDVVDIRRCKGHAGIPVVWTNEPDSSSVDFGRASDAAIPHLDIFYVVRGTVEWRGPVVNGAVAPIAAIVRYDSGRSIGRLGTSRLVVYRLSPAGRSCVMGVSGSNETARAIVDHHATNFVCGRRVLQS